MNKFWILILAAFFSTNSLDKAECVKVKLEETPLKTFDEIFGEGWWDKDEAEDLKTPAPTNFGQNVHHQIDRQNTQFGQIETNSTDQNPPLTESDHSHNTKNVEEPKEIMKKMTSNAEDERKRKIIDKFHAMKDEFKQKGKYSAKARNQIEQKIAEHLKVSRPKIYKWKKEFGLNRKVIYEKEERKYFVEKFDQRKAELKRAGFKNSYSNQIDETVAKELGLSFVTIYNWKSEFGRTTPNHKHSDSEQKELMKLYYEIKALNPKISDNEIAKRLTISRVTLFRWKNQFKQQQFYPNSVDGHSVEENAGSNIQEIENNNSGT